MTEPSPTFAGRRLDDDGTATPDRLADEAAHAGATPPPEPLAPAAPARRRPVDVDDDLEPVAARSALEAIADEVAAELAEDVEDRTITRSVPGRPGYQVRYLCTIEYDELTAWTRKATTTVGKGHKRREVVNELALGRIVLANRCEAIIRHGEELVDAAGELVTFATPSFQDIVGATRAVEAVQALYGRDADIIAASAEVMETAAATDEDDDDLIGGGAPTPT